MTSFSILSQKHFKVAILVSLGIHIVGFMLVFFFPLKWVSKKSVIKEAIRVDMVGLPDLVRPSQNVPKATAKKPTVAIPKKPKKPVKKDKPKKPIKKDKPKKPVKKPPPQKKQIEKEQNRSRLQTAQMKALQSLREAVEPPKYKGEEISKGDSTQGEVDNSLRYWYFTRVKAHIKMFWNLPRLLADKNLKATVIIEVNKEGNIMKIRLEKSSGHESFDQIVIDTIRQSSPLPAPPEELRSMLRDGVGFNFPD